MKRNRYSNVRFSPKLLRFSRFWEARQKTCVMAKQLPFDDFSTRFIRTFSTRSVLLYFCFAVYRFESKSYFYDFVRRCKNKFKQNVNVTAGIPYQWCSTGCHTKYHSSRQTWWNVTNTEWAFGNAFNLDILRCDRQLKIVNCSLNSAVISTTTIVQILQ